MKPVLQAVLAVAVVTAAGCVHAQTGVAPVRADTAKLDRTLDSLATAHRGVVGYSIHNIDTGERLSLRGDETFPTASLIKVPVLVTLYDMAERKQISLDDPVTVLRVDQVPGSGVLQRFHNGTVITIGDAAWLMSIISDNTATNLILDHVPPRRVWAKMDSLGLTHTRIHSKVFSRITSVAMDSSVKYGIGVSTPNEMARLFALMAQGRAVSPKADSSMLAILENNEDFEMMNRLTYGVRVAHKTGAVDKSRTECSLYYLQSRVVACVFTKENVDERYAIDSESQTVMAKIGKAIVDAWPPAPTPPATP